MSTKPVNAAFTASRALSVALFALLASAGLGGCVAPPDDQNDLADELNEDIAEGSDALTVGAPAAMQGDWQFHYRLLSGVIENSVDTLNADGTITENSFTNPDSDWLAYGGQFLVFNGVKPAGAGSFYKPAAVSALYGVGSSTSMMGIRLALSSSSVDSVWTANRSNVAATTPSGSAPVYDITGAWTTSVDWGITGDPISGAVSLNADGTFQVTTGLMETGRYRTYRVSSGEQYMVMVFSNNNATFGGKVSCPPSGLQIDGISMQTMTYSEDPRRQGTFTMHR